ncbi:PREDICTED: UDP-glucose:glycoprotein glucosyltransferase 1-like [Amphimedon queenslandica]|nr:PREDICTED: UDP-glucose:glycoprotein glucosyltransferase 1-like [Amphimedon queenslandica]|eukprot:XP_019859687.1 PREDICTED: UDP-glucose:glycoprotein glucosyltransferase 1-like [Amphimedon queenslandica]
MAAFEKRMKELASSSVFEYQREFLKRVLQLEPGASAILSNGRLIGPLGPKESFIFDDLEALYNFEISSHVQTISNAIDSVDLILPDPDSDTTEYRSDLVMRLASLLRSQTKARRLELDSFKKEHSVLSVPPLSSGPVIHILLILDPLSPSSQKLSPLLGNLKDLLPLNITVLFNPLTKLSALPLKE